ncbi:pentapeptide repeat-containing protein [Archangium lansingense]|uniref:pentapeptide repeat-containing protein n=1 Tax=Archangium lansingense TaxID=2995310 RepID=UPI003B81AC88
MEPVVAIGALSKILGVGISTWEALKSPDFDEKDLSALRTLLETGGGALGATLSPKDAQVAAQHMALITRAFGQAFGRHWAFNKDFVPTGRFRAFMSKEQRQRAKEIEVRTRYAAQKLQTTGDLPAGAEELGLVSALTGSPLNTPYYRALWAAFSNPKLANEEAGEPPLLELTEDTRREFERHFLIAYWEGLASSTGRGIGSYIEGLEKYRTLLIRELLLKDLSTWNERHLFGNTERSKTPQSYGLPFMPLGEMYVEPDGKIEGNKDNPAEPILVLLARAIRQPAPKVIFVKADFGSGKSLTARTLAYRLATKLLTTQEGTSLDQDFPIFIRCADDFPSEGSFELSPTVRRAWKRQVAASNVDLKTSDNALSLPGDEQRIVYILDGLDEIALGERRLDALMQRLQEETTDRHRFIIFSRPGALPIEHKLTDSIVISLLPFTTHDENEVPGGQVGEWLGKWNKVVRGNSPLHPEQLVVKHLLEIAKTPILLFMISQSWDDISSTDTPKRLSEIYEGFFRHIARGKHEFDRESNTNVFEASNHLLDHLKRLNEIGAAGTAPEAMLWLMSRLAWEATKLEQRHPPEPLTTRDVDRLLEDELELRPSSELTSTIRMGLLLAMQADFRAGADHVLFGHKSFREFLVARFWVDRLRKIASADSREWAELERSLYGARLLADYAHLNFLSEMIDALNDGERLRIARWAQYCFDNEEQSFKARKGRPSSILRDDFRAALREASLAIGCEISGSRMDIREPLAFRSLVAWFFAVDSDVLIHARGAVLRGTNFNKVELFNPVFGGATFERVLFAGVEFLQGDFSAARLTELKVEISDFHICWFEGAKFEGGVVSYSRFDDCSFRSSFWGGCRFESVSFYECAFDMAKFEDVDFESGRAEECGFGGTRFLRCRLNEVDLSQSDLSGVVFEETQYTDAVVWPEGFNPVAQSGLRRIG